MLVNNAKDDTSEEQENIMMNPNLASHINLLYLLEENRGAKEMMQLYETNQLLRNWRKGLQHIS